MKQTADLKQKKDMIKGFGELFNTKTERVRTEEIPPGERQGYMEPCNVAMVVPKNVGTRDLIKELFDVTESKIPPLNYEKEKPGSCKYSSNYLRLLLEMTKNYDSIRISTAKDYPLSAETEDFIFILAPRVDCE